MRTLKPLLAKNRSWALQRQQRHPQYFQQNVEGQQPHSLWIGCSDSRVPAEVLTGAHPGELFVHRNIANMVVSNDDNFMSVLQYAIEYLQVSRIVLCGHYGCGGVQAALTLPDLPLNDENSALARRITLLRTAITSDLAPLSAQEDDVARLNRLVEANVLAQFSQLVKTVPVVNAWRKGVDLDVFGCVYDLHSGHLKELVQQQSEGGRA
ncbi:carbonic anhydrase [Erwinia pyrifoliae]|uniref:Carbonic anhydrase n=1 Tax=Erwinia pyrifoliae TaxID=79967 RepID=A0ABY5X7G1_ERWPY|nr:carbonic anhydrase [Erwinia pyrifoliae]AUX73840.1 carbonic anhydrase [Erwinia pyrifoliae]MCA8875831.1 carbonic anhydrase [Erwinia pyrifoliae]MCT2387627.1 carbonic anhydrase [Erwinia pyrifoliae]MCU8585883.1 carbonic anhydrase [Erwinia pyrifoliae]UWS28817.1 carbonic anhydrase [Erwinia pyrifoliae]